MLFMILNKHFFIIHVHMCNICHICVTFVEFCFAVITRNIQKHLVFLTSFKDHHGKSQLLVGKSMCKKCHFSMYVDTCYANVHIYTYTHTRACVYIYKYVCVCACMHIYIYIHMHIYIYTQVPFSSCFASKYGWFRKVELDVFCLNRCSRKLLKMGKWLVVTI